LRANIENDQAVMPAQRKPAPSEGGGGKRFTTAQPVIQSHPGKVRLDPGSALRAVRDDE
jgi:hypothetical protein